MTNDRCVVSEGGLRGYLWSERALIHRAEGRESPAREIIVVTEAGLLHRLGKEIPNKTFIPGPTDNCFCGECRFMKMNTLEKAYDALLNMEPEITLPEPLRRRAEIPIRRMLELSK